MTSLPPPKPLAPPVLQEGPRPLFAPPLAARPQHDTPVPDSRHWLRRLYAPLFTARPWVETVHLLLDFPIGIAVFVATVVLV
ncbi:MAG: hypothetical protein JWL70_2689, partial [Acidimicrobiia bacterium]|nr:hypothetical protein [Acidimicrobiia bacterium]